MLGGVLYGHEAAVHHLWIPPNWVAWLTGADGEAAYDAAFVSLILDAGFVGLAAWLMFRRRRSTPTGEHRTK